MWEISINNQISGFGISILLGIILCIFYDIFRVKRKIIFSSAIVIFFEDIFYFSVSAVVVFCFLLALTNGVIRAYIILGLVLGFIFCRYTFSKVSIFVFTAIIKLLLKIKIIISALKLKLFCLFWTIKEKISKILSKILKKVVNILKKG